MSHDDGATIRLVAALVRAYDDGEGHMAVSLHPETLREMAFAAKREVERLRAERAALLPITSRMVPAREAARRRMPLDGADAQALEHAITVTERERDAARTERDARPEGITPEDAKLVLAVAAWPIEDSIKACDRVAKALRAHERKAVKP